MNIYITQGHEQGIGLEVFFKSFLMASSEDLSKLILIAYPDAASQTLESMKVPFKVLPEGLNIAGRYLKTTWLRTLKHSQSFTALLAGMKHAEAGGVLLTLPTSKDQFPGFAGHTEFFRSHYQSPELGMFFSSPMMQVLLLSDHIPLAKVSEELTEQLIFDRLQLALKALQQWSWSIKRVLVSGMNPHAGEAGLIGHEDDRVRLAIKRLGSKNSFPISGPYPGDTVYLERRSTDDLLVYLYHDQGLGVFKGLQGFIGSNVTLGLSYPRLSPDHGTSFSLYGKNQADYRGCAFALKESLHLARRISNGKNTSH